MCSVDAPMRRCDACKSSVAIAFDQSSFGSRRRIMSNPTVSIRITSTANNVHRVHPAIHFQVEQQFDDDDEPQIVESHVEEPTIAIVDPSGVLSPTSQQLEAYDQRVAHPCIIVLSFRFNGFYI